MQQFTLTLFGGFHLADAAGKPLTPATRKAKALLAWLALNPAREHLREKLASMFWPDSDEAQARHSLRQTLVELHRIMPETAGVLHTTRETVLLDEQTLAVDALEFNAALAQGDEAALDHAIGLYQGELLEGCNPRSDIFDDWLTNYRNDYSVRAVATIQQRLADLLEQQDYQHAILFATRLLAIDPLQESAYRTLMQANAGLGDAAAALLWYQRCQRVLQHELGVAPSPETRALHDRLTASRDTQQIQPPPPAPAPQCGCPRHAAPDPSKRVLCLLKTALQGIVCNGMGHSFLIRGGTRQQKSSLVDNILTLASLQHFSCQHHTLPTADSAGQQTLLPHQQGTTTRPALLLVEHIHRADRATLESLASLISAAGSSSTLLVMTSCFEGEPLDPVWRGAMRGAPLTTVDL